MLQQAAVAQAADNAADLVRHAVLGPQTTQVRGPHLVPHRHAEPVVDVLAEPLGGVSPLGLDDGRQLLRVTGVDKVLGRQKRGSQGVEHRSHRRLVHDHHVERLRSEVGVENHFGQGAARHENAARQLRCCQRRLLVELLDLLLVGLGPRRRVRGAGRGLGFGSGAFPEFAADVLAPWRSARARVSVLGRQSSRRGSLLLPLGRAMCRAGGRPASLRAEVLEDRPHGHVHGSVRGRDDQDSLFLPQPSSDSGSYRVVVLPVPGGPQRRLSGVASISSTASGWSAFKPGYARCRTGPEQGSSC